MKINPFTAAIAPLSALALCATPPIAWAESPTMDGVYHYADEDGAVGTWIIRTMCTPNFD